MSLSCPVQVLEVRVIEMDVEISSSLCTYVGIFIRDKGLGKVWGRGEGIIKIGSGNPFMPLPTFHVPPIPISRNL